MRFAAEDLRGGCQVLRGKSDAAAKGRGGVRLASWAARRRRGRVCGNRLKKVRRVGRFLGVSFFRVDTPPNFDVPKKIKLTAAAAAEHPDFSTPPPYEK